MEGEKKLGKATEGVALWGIGGRKPEAEALAHIKNGYKSAESRRLLNHWLKDELACALLNEQLRPH